MYFMKIVNVEEAFATQMASLKARMNDIQSTSPSFPHLHPQHKCDNMSISNLFD